MRGQQQAQKIHYEIIKKREQETSWLTIVHGFSHTHHYFSAQIPEFQQDFRLFLRPFNQVS